MAKVRISFRDAYVNKKGEAPLVLVTHLLRRKVRINTGISINPKNWNDAGQLIRGKTKHTADLNLVLSDCLAQVNDIMVKYRLQRVPLTAELLKYEYDHYASSIDFIAFMEEEIKARRHELEPSTMSHHNACLNKLKVFQKEIAFVELTEDFVHRYKAHLRDVRKNEAYTISANLKVFKTYINIAIRRKIVRENPFRYVPLTRPRNERIYLDEDEIKAMIDLYDKQSLSKTFQKVLRHFLFSVSTGLRISDIKSITMDNIFRDMLIFTPEKTKNKKSQVVRIPLKSLALRMIKDESPFRLKGPVFLMISEAKTNEYLKAIAGDLKIKKRISFHSARHTFATYFLKRTKNILALQKLLGHSNITDTMVYSHICMDDIEKEMVCFDDLIR